MAPLGHEPSVAKVSVLAAAGFGREAEIPGGKFWPGVSADPFLPHVLSNLCRLRVQPIECLVQGNHELPQIQRQEVPRH